MLYLETEYRVIYGDTDKMGVVYYANYLRFFEIGRTELLRSWQLPYSQLEAEEGFWLPVSEVQCKYLAPAEYDDLIIIRAALDPDVKAGLKIDYTITDHDRETLAHLRRTAAALPRRMDGHRPHASRKARRRPRGWNECLGVDPPPGFREGIRPTAR